MNYPYLIDSKLNKVLLGIRPEMMTEPKPYNNNKYVHEIDFYVKVVEPMGADTLATGQWNNNEVQARLSPESGKNIVDKFRLQVDTSKVVLFNIDTGERI